MMATGGSRAGSHELIRMEEEYWENIASLGSMARDRQANLELLGIEPRIYDWEHEQISVQ